MVQSQKWQLYDVWLGSLSDYDTVLPQTWYLYSWSRWKKVLATHLEDGTGNILESQCASVVSTPTPWMSATRRHKSVSGTYEEFSHWYQIKQVPLWRKAWFDVNKVNQVWLVTHLDAILQNQIKLSTISLCKLRHLANFGLSCAFLFQPRLPQRATPSLSCKQAQQKQAVIVAAAAVAESYPVKTRLLVTSLCAQVTD